ncbi:ADP-ribosylation [Coniophora puteana RWD-64-598 SS2]|uniref:Poly [ADP-ribose] polymerase n=1 Tax=Coniophora puteana (strain RWD-64-598) TaxID=741705 RepID=A0A5M3MKJ6_CONPW|nr:ADP-ribosylation [Coniophora puteana RWD-64-598 SS2]EIW79344.1 ADP-ribosylation [Coniophora puteana RWD-64-598 SS2]
MSPILPQRLSNPANSRGGKRVRLSCLDKRSEKFAEVEQLFRKAWRHRKKEQPQVQNVFKVLWPESLLEPYLEYREQVESSRQSKDANEKLLFHGTNRACLLGESRDNVLLCPLKSCYLCSILRSSFDVKKCGQKNSFKRFGHGIYTSACSSKADDYTLNASQDARLRIVVLCRVVVGKTYKRYRNAPELTEPPKGYHSVSGEVGWDLNYEETVCYNNDAIRPAYIVVYGNEPPVSLNFKAFVSTIFHTPLAS